MWQPRSMREPQPFASERDSLPPPSRERTRCYVDALIAASADDTVLTEAFEVGWPAPHRVLRSWIVAAESLIGEVAGTIDVGGSFEDVGRLTPQPPTKGTTGRIDAMAQYAGTSVDAVTRRASAAEILEELCVGIV